MPTHQFEKCRAKLTTTIFAGNSPWLWNKTEDDSTRQTVFKFANVKVASGFHCLDDSFFSRNFFGTFWHSRPHLTLIDIFVQNDIHSVWNRRLRDIFDRSIFNLRLIKFNCIYYIVEKLWKSLPSHCGKKALFLLKTLELLNWSSDVGEAFWWNDGY